MLPTADFRTQCTHTYIFIRERNGRDTEARKVGRNIYIKKLINIHPYTHTHIYIYIYIFMPIHTNSTKVKGFNVECKGIAYGIMTTKHVHKEREHKTERKKEREREREN